MAPDRGSISIGDGREYQAIGPELPSHSPSRAVSEDLAEDEEETALGTDIISAEVPAEHAGEGENFTVRGVLVGLGIGVVICFSNTYFGLQTGWVSGMAMPAALIGFAFFKTLAKHIAYPFTPVENVLVQTVAGAVGTMPLGCGFVGVVPALTLLLTPDEGGPLVIGTWKLIVWAVGLCFFGVFIAVPLRRQVIIREKLKFPSGTATALVIGVLHGDQEERKVADSMATVRRMSVDVLRLSMSGSRTIDATGRSATIQPTELDHRNDWKAKIRLLMLSFAFSAVYTLFFYFIPQLHDLPILGSILASKWLWTLNPSPAYVGQGIIMGPATTLHMLLGAVVGWGVLSPLAKYRGWAPGPVDDWGTGSQGWIVWVSLAVMLADSVVSLGWLLLRPAITDGPRLIRKYVASGHMFAFSSSKGRYVPLETRDGSTSVQSAPEQTTTLPPRPKNTSPIEPDAPPRHLIGNWTVCLGLLSSIAICIASIHIVFAEITPLYASIAAVLVSLLLSIMGVRALGETDLNPVSGISKLAQLFFAVLIPASNPNAISINLIAGAISESAALQAGDMMQDLKTGHLLGAAPSAQFYGQLIGSFVGAIVSALVYQLYTSAYAVPGTLFRVPTAYVWIFTARLITGKGLPPMAGECALGAGLLFAVLTAVRIAGRGHSWQPFVPGGIAVAIGMFNVPSFTLARTVGGLGSLWWGWKGGEEGAIVVLASGLILGEGLMSIVNLALTSFRVPHL